MAEERQPQKTQYEKIQEITDRLEQGISELFSSEKYAAWLSTMSKFHNYSLNNTILIAMQRPDATQVASYTSWKNNFGRQVLKGEKAIRILAPAPYKRKQETEKTDPNTGEVLFNPDGTPQKEMREVLMPAFKVVNVFDISQTEGRELPTIGVDELNGDVENFSVFFEALKKTCPVPMEFEEIASGAKGYYHQTERRIAIQKGMSQVQTVKTAIHEMSHQRLHAIDPEQVSGEKKSGNTKEVEAESVAFVVCQHYGMDTGDYSFAYIASWSEGKETPELKASLNTIRKTASDMITEIDGHMLELQRTVENRAEELAGKLSDFAEMFSPYEFADAGEDREAGIARLKGELLKGGAEAQGIVDYLQEVISDGGEYSVAASQLIDQIQPFINESKAVSVEQTEAAFRVGDSYLEIHEAYNGGWDYTLFGPNYREIDGGQLGESGTMSMQQAVKEIAQCQSLAEEMPTEMSRDTLENLVLLYDPAKSDELIRFEGSLVEKGLDPKTVYSAEQWKQIESGLSDEVDVSVFADPAFSAEQMDMLHRALVAEYDGYLTHEQVQLLAEPGKPAQEMYNEMKTMGRAHIYGDRGENSKVYRYYSTQRPIGPGTIPTAQKPVEIVNFDNRVPVENGRFNAWGYVEYARPLTQKQVDGFELRSASSGRISVRDALTEKKNQSARREQNHRKTDRGVER